MLLPYRAKNPPETFPWATISLIALNVVIYLVGADWSSYGLVTRDTTIAALALTHRTFSLWRLVTCMFLHFDLLHIAGNMLFLWVFGAATEGRLKAPKFLILYFTAGLIGGMLSDFLTGIADPEIGYPQGGASGAIMGVIGGYIYMFPFSRICIFTWFFFRPRVYEMHAMWVAIIYFALDILNGVILRGNDGVGHYAHIGGFLVGFAIAYAFFPRRDDERYSAVQATMADVKDYGYMTFNELDTLMRMPEKSAKLLIAYCNRALTEARNGEKIVMDTVANYAPMLMEQANPSELAVLVSRIPREVGNLPQVFYLRLGSRLERVNANEQAMNIYFRIYQIDPSTRDAEAAMFRLGQLMERVYNDPEQSKSIYEEMEQRFPMGVFVHDVRRELNRLQKNTGSSAGVKDPVQGDGQAPSNPFT